MVTERPQVHAFKSLPGSIEETRVMVAYHERIVATSGSRERQQRSDRSLGWLRPLLVKLEREETAKGEETARLQRIAASAPPASSFEGRVQQWRETRADQDEALDTVWSGDEWRRRVPVPAREYPE